ncbi:cellulase family glycosylhydrolase [Flectobacillus roseus]|uniref:cellulase family glycosylhydrolase n=1 Tax=Flectobacillus roseus TaxID=502259 RepID=UPI0024B76C4C|nr:cellulase family glycosylhydrolase [Flectobacillus roseus]MDI9870761.1 cellulase family glycosylhydrolase [Flectobacillus roseus]
MIKFKRGWYKGISLAALMMCTISNSSTAQVRKIWTKEQANEWYKKQGWLVGANYLPKSAINQLEMWQADTFDTENIDKELGYAQSLGMNTMRVFLHDLAYETDSLGFYKRIDTFLTIAQKHKIRPLIVIFDSCWDPFPQVGKQHEPKPYVHNSGWVQSPGQKALQDESQYIRLEKYVRAVVSHYAKDKRILGWDVWNEPDNMTGPSYERLEIKNKVDIITKLLPKVFAWARAAKPTQPLTSGVWAGDWSQDAKLKPIEKVQLEESDVISFHNYDNPTIFENRIKELSRYGKPMLCTEYMARPNGSTFQGSLPIAKKYKVAMFNWGFVSGKSQTIYPWDSWTKQYNSEPPVWFHDIFREDGSPYKQEEVDFIKSMTLKK